MKSEDQQRLLQLARLSICRRMDGSDENPSVPKEIPAELRMPGASFVTLEMDGHLRGCIGSLEAFRPLIEDVQANACAAAFEDPRFPPLSGREMKTVKIRISVLSSPEKIECASEAELLSKIRPGVDGLILEEGLHRATFLPSVWEQLPDKRDFLFHLKMKAGLQGSYWSDTLCIFRYAAEYFGD